jgi:hypothetical protein
MEEKLAKILAEKIEDLTGDFEKMNSAIQKYINDGDMSSAQDVFEHYKYNYHKAESLRWVIAVIQNELP